MPRLTAEFKIKIDSPCLIAWPDGESPKLAHAFDGFEVVVDLVPDWDWKTKHESDEYWTTGITHLKISISKFEQESPPEIAILENGIKDLTLHGKYFGIRLNEYSTVARKTANRILNFFRYELFTPLIREISAWDNNLHNPIWLDEDGKEIRSGSHIRVLEPIPGLMGELGAKKLTPNDINSLNDHIANPPEPSLSVSLLSDAQTAWHEGNLRRTILELAICTEVMVKRCYFAQATPAGCAFDYLEDKAKISVKVLDLLGPIATEAFGTSYKTAFPDKYIELDHLFRCRNKIAHRGELNFRDDKGFIIPVDSFMVNKWWNITLHLKHWLNAF